MCLLTLAGREALMPPSADVLAGLTAIANAWRSVAIAWHVVFAALVCVLVVGWRPSRRLLGICLAAPLATVGVLSWTAGNPFNGTVFAALSVGLAMLAARLPARAIRIAPPALAGPGALLVAFGWVYPHFLQTGEWTSYLYAAPLGLLPCPTLSAVIGLSLIVNLLGSRSWAIALGSAGILFGVIGAVRLEVGVDLILLAGAGYTVFAALSRHRAPQHIRVRPPHATT
jgi:hypothetical protein